MVVVKHLVPAEGLVPADVKGDFEKRELANPLKQKVVLQELGLKVTLQRYLGAPKIGKNKLRNYQYLSVTLGNKPNIGLFTQSIVIFACS